MASPCTKRLCTNERFVSRLDADCWRSEFIHTVGLDSISAVLWRTSVVEDLGRLTDCKPASVSNWSFAESCLYCCLRREKVKEHVVALNKQIVESGGKPLLGKDPSNINRLEWQSEEFLNAVLQRKKYTPRIPDPHIPVVACGIVQQMINELATYYTSRKKCSQDSLQNNGEKDFLKPSCVISPTAVNITSALNKFIMVDQDAPLDLSVKKVKVEDIEQDGVLDLSTRKSSNKSHTTLRNSNSPATHLVKRDSVDLSLAREGDLQSVSTLEQFMSKLCLHHQRQIVDALGFLQSEVKTLASSNPFQAPTPNLTEKKATTFEARSERTCSVDAAVGITNSQEVSIVRTSQKPTGEVLNAGVARVMTEKPVDLCKMEALSSSSCGTDVERGKESSPNTFFVMTKTTSDHQEAKQLKQIQSSDSVCSAERCLPTESDHPLSRCTQKSSFARSKDADPSTIHKTSNVVSPISVRTARKSRKGPCLRQSNGSLSCIINDTDSHCDLVYIRKSITECQLQSRNRLHPRHNARKSIRGHKYVEEYLELKTVRTLARNSSGNCPTRMPDVHTSVAPKQALSTSGSVPLINAPFAGDCMENVIHKFASEQNAENEIPGVKVPGLGLEVETSQTGKVESNGQISQEPTCKPSESTVQPDLITEALVNPNSEVQGDICMVEETTELAVQKEGCESQIEPMLEEVECGAESEDKSLEPPPSPNKSSDGVDDVEPRNESEMTNPSEVESAADVHKESETSEIKANTDEDKSSQDTESNFQTTNSSNLPVEDQGDSVVSRLPEVSTGQPLLKCKDKDTDGPKVVNPKHTVSSDRCLRSRVSKGGVDLVKDSVRCERANETTPKTQSTETKARIEEECDSKAQEILETAQELPAAKPCSSLVVDGAVKTRPKLRNAKERDEQTNPSVKMHEELPSVLPPEALPETVSGKPHKRNNQASENTPIKTESSPIKLSDSPIKKSPPSSENMLLRSRRNTERTSGSKSANPTEGLSEKQEQMPLRSSSTEQATNKDSCTSSEGVTRMPLRSRTITTTKQTVTKDSPVKSCVSEHPISSQSSRKTEANVHMPLRSSASLIADPPNNKSPIVDALESPGRMALRRGNASNSEKSVGSTSPPSKNKRPLRPQRVSASSSGEAEESPLSSKPKTQTRKHVEPQIRGPLDLPGEEICRNEPVVCSASKFFEALRGEEHQRLISDLNTTFEKMHKGWVQMEKEGQPAPKPKNKADRLKEIWKSKRRARKSRPLEPQRFSPVQMLFMKPFDLPSICRWFLQSTETKSLVIVKKVNTRLPSETQLCFHSSSAGAGSSQGIFPSLQAERLKKHLKKFAMASPVKSNPKNQRLISKALGQGISVMRSKEKHEPTTATRISTKAQSLNGVAPPLAPESLGAIAGPASARILRKYSNMREKLQVQQNKKCNEKGARLKAALIPKKVDKLPSPKGPKSVVVQRIKSLTKRAKANSALKEQALRKNQCHKHDASPKRLRALKNMTKAIGERASGKKRILLKSGTKAQQVKTSETKADLKKSVLQKGFNTAEPHSVDVDIKPLALEDQVLTRSQRKMEVSSAQTGSPKASTKRGSEPPATPAKRTRTSKP